MQPRADVHQGLWSLKGRDPAFEVRDFLERTRSIFIDVQQAWFVRRLTDVRHVMSDGLFRRFLVLHDLMKAEGRRDALAGLRVLRMEILEASLTEGFDVVTVAIEAEVRDAEVPASFDDTAAQQAALRASLTTFEEAWTFVRRPGATTRVGFGAAARKCPHCGAPFERGATNTCDYCSVIVNSGQYDWVLTEITQPSEYSPLRRTPPGLDVLRSRDPDAATEVLEDRALLLFWKWLECWALNHPNQLRKVAAPGIFESQMVEMNVHVAAGQRMVIRTPAVGSADVTAVEVDVDGFDRVHVDIRWSASITLDANGPAGTLGSARTPVRHRRHTLTMIRKTGAQTGQAGLATDRCGTCRAPLSDTETTTCDHCGHDLIAGDSEWLLAALIPVVK